MTAVSGATKNDCEKSKFDYAEHFLAWSKIFFDHEINWGKEMGSECNFKHHILGYLSNGGTPGILRKIRNSGNLKNNVSWAEEIDGKVQGAKT